MERALYNFKISDRQRIGPYPVNQWQLVRKQTKAVAELTLMNDDQRPGSLSRSLTICAVSRATEQCAASQPYVSPEGP